MAWASARPRHTASPDGKHIYVCASDDDLVRVFDPETMQETHTLPSGPDPELFVLSPDGGRLYIANEDDNLVTVVDTRTHKVLAEIPVGVEPEGMAVSPDGKVLAATSADGDQILQVFSLGTHKLVSTVGKIGKVKVKDASVGQGDPGAAGDLGQEG